MEHPSLIHDPSSPSRTNSPLGADANDFEPMLDVVQGVAFIDGLLPSSCCGEMTLDSAITNQVMELQRDMDEAKAPIALQNKVLSRLLGGRANASDATNYTSMGLAQLIAPEESPCVEN